MCGISYQRAHRTLRRAGRKDRTGTPDYVLRRALNLLGYSVIRRMRPSLDARTLRTIEDSDAIDCGGWVIHVANHWVGMIDRTIHDSAVGRALRVKSAFKVVRYAK